MATDITPLIALLSGELNDNAYKASDTLGHFGSEDVIEAMIDLLNHPSKESRYMAARTLGLVKNNGSALNPMMEAIKNNENSAIAGDLLMELEGFDISAIYVDLFKLYLFGSFKVSAISKDLLDHKEFDITPRVIRKAEKHWNHYSNNVKQDEVYALRKIEIDEILNDLNAYVDALDK